MFWFENSTDANKLYTALDNTYEAIAVSRLDVGQKGTFFKPILIEDMEYLPTNIVGLFNCNCT